MFENIARRWHEARGSQLKKELMDSVQQLNCLREPDAERFGRGLSQSYNYWVETNGPVKHSPENLRKYMANEAISRAKNCYDHDIGVSYAWAFLSFHLESSFLPGEDAEFVYETTGTYIAGADEICKQTANPSISDVENHLNAMNYRLTPYGAGFVALSLASGYRPVEVASRIVVITLAFDAREAGRDLDRLDSSFLHAGELIKMLGKLENTGQIRTEIAKHDARAIWGIANPSVERKEWIKTVLSDPAVGKDRLAVRID